MPSFLDEVITHKKEEIKAKEQARPLASFQSEVRKAEGRFKTALEGDGLKLIAEIKPRSPALGEFKNDGDMDSRIETYQQYAQAVSVLCDKKYFGGSLELLKSISSRINVPTLLKDFVISPYQLYEGRFAGAEAALLIAKILSKEQLIELNSLCAELGMPAVVEVQTEAELDFVKCIKPDIVLVNNRNLDNLEIDLNTVKQLHSLIDFPCILIAASGIDNAEDLIAIRPYASRFLIGSALMKTANPAEKFQEFIEAEKRYPGSAASASPPLGGQAASKDLSNAGS